MPTYEKRTECDGKKAQEAIKDYKAKCDAIGEVYGAKLIIKEKANARKKFNRADFDVADSGASGVFKTSVDRMMNIREPEDEMLIEGAHGKQSEVTLEGEYRLLPDQPALKALVSPELTQDLLCLQQINEEWDMTSLLDGDKIRIIKNKDLPPIPEDKIVLQGPYTRERTCSPKQEKCIVQT
jgi:hypothetical protein